MPLILLADRALVRLSGGDAEELLQRLITTDLDDVALNEAGYGALLAPQGKILMDFLVTRQEDGFLFDLPESLVDAFIKKMTLYRMRSDVDIKKVEGNVAVSLEPVENGIKDPRAEALGWRLYQVPMDTATDAGLQDDFLIACIKASVPQDGLDFDYGNAFPHDINMDDLGGLDFQKGCYVGQEVVSRMQHRGTARKRLVKVSTADGSDLPQTGSTLLAGSRKIGLLGAASGADGLALLRLDHVESALEESEPISIEGVEVKVLLPAYATFDANFPTIAKEKSAN